MVDLFLIFALFLKRDYEKDYERERKHVGERGKRTSRPSAECGTPLGT